MNDEGSRGSDGATRTSAGRSAAYKVAATVAAILAITAIAVWLIFRFVDEERDREMFNWQTRLGIVADSRAAAVESWVAGSAGVLANLAENDALRRGIRDACRSLAAAAAQIDGITTDDLPHQKAAAALVGDTAATLAALRNRIGGEE